jgi:hypothetical protein
MTIPEHGYIPIPLQTAQVGVTQINGIETLPNLTAARASPASAARVKKTDGGDIARRE